MQPMVDKMSGPALQRELKAMSDFARDQGHEQKMPVPGSAAFITFRADGLFGRFEDSDVRVDRIDRRHITVKTASGAELLITADERGSLNVDVIS